MNHHWFPVLPKNRQVLIVLLPIFIAAYALLVAIYHDKTEDYAISEAKKAAMDVLVSHKAVHRYVVETQRPEIYRLQGEGLLYKEYFSPKVMSFTYIARSIKELINSEREKVGLPPVYFKLAADNPRNPVNQADEFESALLARMNRGEVKEIREIVQQNGEPTLHVAVPIDRSTAGCLKCHGDPQDAPAELVARYGSERGFHESPNSIRALISIRVPLALSLQEANEIADMLSLVTLLVMTAIYGLTYFFVLRFDREQRVAITSTQALQNAKEYAENLIHTANVMMVELDLAGNVKRVNPAAEQVTGYSVEELLGRNWFETLVPRDRYPSVWKMFQEVSAKGIPKHFENPIVTKSGDEHYIIWQNSEMREGGRVTGLVSFGIDMTENRRISQNLAEQDVMLHSAQHIAQLGTWRLNHADQVLTWSDEMFNIYEMPYSPGPVSRETWFDGIHPDDRERVRSALAYSLDSGAHYDITYRLQLPGGIEKYVHEHCEPHSTPDGSAQTSIGVVQDVTEHVLSEQSVRESELRFRTIADFTYDWEYWQGAQGEILYINPACQRVSGYSQAEFISRPTLLMDIVHPDDHQRFHDHHAKTQNNSLSSLEFRIVTKEGQIRWIGHGCRAVFGADGLPMGRRVSNRDITDSKLAEDELEQYRNHLEAMVAERTTALSIAKDAAEAANRAKTQFLATVSHELRTPMNAIMGMTELALRRATDPKQIDQLNKSKDGAQRLLGIINDILDISRIEADRLDLENLPFTLGEVLDTVTGLMGRKATEKNLDLRFDWAPDVATLSLRGDPLRLGQVLLTLTGNAIKFTEKGSVTVTLRQIEESASDVQLRFEVHDTGIGISVADRQRIFTAFEQADGSMTRKHGGTGLGLAICKRLVIMMRGNVGVDSQPGIGSTFWFTVRLDKATDKVPPARFVGQDKTGSG